MIARGFDEADLTDCLEVQPARLGAELIGSQRAIRAWKDLVRSPSFRSSVIEVDPPVAGRRIVGFGASVFVTRDFAEKEVSNPRPGLNGRIIASVDSGRSVVLTEAQLRAANTRGGLDVVVLYGSLLRGILSVDAISTAHTLLPSRFVEDHAGYRVNRFFSELVDEEEKYYYVDRSHALRIVSNYDDFHSAYPHDRRAGHVLAIMTKEDSLSVTGSLLNLLFQYKEPSLRLRDADQQLLLAALGGLTDEDLADKLELSLPAVKKRWRSVFARVTDSRLDLFSDVARDPDALKRGRQKRHYVLAYVRAHPEELRPREPDS